MASRSMLLVQTGTANLLLTEDSILDQRVIMPVNAPLSLQRRWWRLALPGESLRVDGGRA